MNTEQIRQQFLEAYLAHNEIRYERIPDPPQKYHYKIFYLLSLEALANEIKNIKSPYKKYEKSDDDFDFYYGARFIVDMDKIIKFSREGQRSRYVPAHSDIERRVLTAGQILFSEDYTQIVGISSKSGHFRPPFSSLVFAIALILNGNFPLAKSIELKNEQTKESIMLSKEELMALLPTELLDNINAMMEANQTEGIFEDKLYEPDLSSSEITTYPIPGEFSLPPYPEFYRLGSSTNFLGNLFGSAVPGFQSTETQLPPFNAFYGTLPRGINLNPLSRKRSVSPNSTDDYKSVDSKRSVSP